MSAPTDSRSVSVYYEAVMLWSNLRVTCCMIGHGSVLSLTFLETVSVCVLVLHKAPEWWSTYQNILGSRRRHCRGVNSCADANRPTKQPTPLSTQPPIKFASNLWKIPTVNFNRHLSITEDHQLQSCKQSEIQSLTYLRIFSASSGTCRAQPKGISFG